jgi:glucose/arabinose dehydrogenase/plastocyanin
MKTNRRYAFLSLLSVLLAAGLSMALWSGGPSPATAGTASTAPADGTEPLPPGASIQTVLPNVDMPVAMAFDPQGRLFYTERVSGKVRLFASGILQANAVITFNVDSSVERGLLGIAIDPGFTTNHFIYVYYTCAVGTGCPSTENRVARFTETNGSGSGPTTIFSSPQTAGNHNGGNIHFGPDGKLYISIGDNANAANSQDVTVKNGKMHRINPDGSIPSDNPVFTQTGALPSLYAMGLRNSFDFTFDPVTPGRIFASENGPSCDDEMNRIEGGYNYGWRANYSCDDPNPSPVYNTIAPLWYIPNGPCCDAPTGITVYTGNQIPQWHNHLFMAAYNSSTLRHFYLDQTRTVVTATNAVEGVIAPMDLETGPDGALWYMEGGGYSVGTLKRIVGSGGGTTTPAGTLTRTPTRTVTRTPTNTRTPNGSATATPTLCPLNFTDVHAPDWFYDYVRCLYCRGAISGYADGTFRPNSNTTRGQMAKIVILAFNHALYTPPSPTFTDVPATHTFYQYIETAAHDGVVSGYTCGTGCLEFRPGNYVTRGQLSKIVVTAAGWGTINPGTSTFADVPASSPFYSYVETSYCHQVISGYDCGGSGEPCPGLYFRPGNTATRAQIAKIVCLAVRNQGVCAVPVDATIESFAFHPQNITINAGTTVQWTNVDLDYHTTTSTGGLWDSGHIQQNQTYSFTFDTPGVYPYICTPHSYMTGTITVIGYR